MKIFFISILLFSTLIYGQNTIEEEQENKIYQLEEYEEIRSEIEEKIEYVEILKGTGSNIHDEILLEYKELREELDRDIGILKMEIKNGNV